MRNKKLLHTSLLLIGIIVSIFNSSKVLANEESHSLSFYIGSSVTEFENTLKTFKEKPLYIQNEDGSYHSISYESLISAISYETSKGTRVNMWN